MIRVRKIRLTILIMGSYLAFISNAMAESFAPHPPKKNFHIEVKMGSGYLELPAVDTIYRTYSKGDNLAFSVEGNGVSTSSLAAYVVDWHGKVLWAEKKAGSIYKAEDYLNKNGWNKLDIKSSNSFDGYISVQTIDRLDKVEMESGNIDACLHGFLFYLKMIAPASQKEGLFIRLLDQPYTQRMSTHCYDGSIATISTKRGHKTGVVSLYKIGPDKALLTDNSVAIMLKPDLSFYNDYPLDYHYISLRDAVEAERRALLSVSKTERPKSPSDTSIFDSNPESFPKAEQVLVNYFTKLAGVGNDAR